MFFFLKSEGVGAAAVEQHTGHGCLSVLETAVAKPIWRAGRKGDGFLAFKEPGGQLYGDDLRENNLTLAFRLAAG